MHFKCVFSVDIWFWCLLKLFELCGFHQSKWTKCSLVKYAVAGLQVVQLCHFTFNEIGYILAISKFMDRLNTLNFALYSFSLLIAYWVVVVESIAKRNVQHEFWTIHGKLIGCTERNALKRNYLFIFSTNFIVNCVTIYISIQDKRTSSNVVITYYILIFMCNNRLMYFLLYVKLVEFELQHMIDTLHSYRCRVNLEHLQRTWNEIGKQYQRIFMLTNQINTFFGWSLLATALISFYTILAYVNFFYQEYDNGFYAHGLSSQSVYSTGKRLKFEFFRSLRFDDCIPHRQYTFSHLLSV